MRILFYINSLGIGGAERVVTNLANRFAINGDNVAVATTVKEEKEYILNEKVKRIIFESNAVVKSKIIRNIKRVFRLRQVCLEEKPDILISFMCEANFRAILATRGLPIKTIVSVRNDPNREYGGLFWPIGKFLLPLADGCVFQTGDAKRWFPKNLQKKSKIILNQVDDVFFNTTYDGPRANIVATGRLEKQKNHELLIRAFASIASQIHDNLIIYGEGSLRPKLEKLVKELGMSERIFLPGAIDNVAETIKSAKLYVLSSDYEGMPNGLMEAMALGIPCISTDCPCGGPRLLIEDGITGFLCRCNDAYGLAKNIKALILYDETLLNKISVKIKISSMKFKGSAIFSDWKDFVMSKLSQDD